MDTLYAWNTLVADFNGKLKEDSYLRIKLCVACSMLLLNKGLKTPVQIASGE